MIAITIGAVWLLALSSSARVEAGAPHAKPTAERFEKRWVWRCEIEEQLPKGQIRASRTYDKAGKLDSGDFFRWEGKGYDPSKRERPISWTIGYIWTANGSERYNDRKAEIDVTLGLDQPIPGSARLEIQRPFPIERGGVIGSTALSTLVFHGAAHTPAGDGYGDIPLGDLLAYADSFDQLDWAVKTHRDEYGNAQTLAQGKIDIAALREASVAIPRLKPRLEKMASNFRKNCKYGEVFSPGVIY
jgi:hypothetical protein